VYSRQEEGMSLEQNHSQMHKTHLFHGPDDENGHAQHHLQKKFLTHSHVALEVFDHKIFSS
jgi:hypothetical protein